MNHAYHPAAEIELLEALRYYRDIDHSLGTDLFHKINRMITDIKSNPGMFRLREGNYRRANLERFPFYLPYITEGNILFIIAIAHNARHPDYWKKRIS